MKKSYLICDFFAGKTVLEYLQSFYLGKSKIERLLGEERIYLNGKKVSFTQVLKLNDILEIDYVGGIDVKPTKRKISIVFEDEYLLILNKPTNILVYPDAKEKTGALVNCVAYYYQNRGFDYHVRYAHRLDIDTTGLVIFVKDELSLAFVMEEISTHKLQRTYLAIATGNLKQKSGTISAPIGSDRHHNQRMRVSKTGKAATTHFEVIKNFKNYSLVKLQLETGRTHQIRVHLASIGHPLVGDELYGGAMLADRPLLHSYQIRMQHPVSRQELIVTKDLPYDMQLFVERK